MASSYFGFILFYCWTIFHCTWLCVAFIWHFVISTSGSHQPLSLPPLQIRNIFTMCKTWFKMLLYYKLWLPSVDCCTNSLSNPRTWLHRSGPDVSKLQPCIVLEYLFSPIIIIHMTRYPGLLSVICKKLDVDKIF